MTNQSILSDINAAVQGFGNIQPGLRTKNTGTATVEVVRKHLKQRNIPVSQRDVFVKGIATEFDLLVPKPEADPALDLVYEPQEVATVLEVKYSGIYGRDVIPELRTTFDEVSKAGRHIRCIYVTIMERRGFKHAATAKTLGYPAYTLHWWSGTTEQRVSWGLGIYCSKI